MSNAWSTPTSSTEAHQRAGGRRHYNAVRQFQAEWRRTQVAKLLQEGFEYGMQARIAKKLGVSKATICRDMRVLLANPAFCPHCGVIKAALA